jgi:hypothetical protein
MQQTIYHTEMQSMLLFKCAKLLLFIWVYHFNALRCTSTSKRVCSRLYMHVYLRIDDRSMSVDARACTYLRRRAQCEVDHNLIIKFNMTLERYLNVC